MGDENGLLKQLAERKQERERDLPINQYDTGYYADDEQAIFDWMERKHERRNNYGYREF
ncbi:hypothetical protein QUF74_05545 [Candidatus Halobeggiatoa sp. HSG11]|nr:hypothetical protein [Candidatus Halobeggiatoa sp. HSG11]